MASILLCYIALVCALIVIPNAHGYQDLSYSNGRYISELYENFYCPFQDFKVVNNFSSNAVEFGVLTMESNVSNLRPEPFQPWGDLLSSTVNYYAAAPNSSYSPPVTVEDQLVEVFDEWIRSQSSPSVQHVYIFTYHSPCVNCATNLSNQANNFPNISFHIGYFKRFGDLSALNGTLRQNIFFGDVSPYCSDRSERGDTTVCTITCDRQASWSEWTEYESCSRTCGGGLQTRQRTCYHGYLSNHEAPGQCSGPSSESQNCSTQQCPTTKEPTTSDVNTTPAITTDETATLYVNTRTAITTDETTTSDVNTTPAITTKVTTTSDVNTTPAITTDEVITVTSLTEILAATTDPPSSNTTTNATSPQNATQGPFPDFSDGGGGRLRDTTPAPIPTPTIEITAQSTQMEVTTEIPKTRKTQTTLIPESTVTPNQTAPMAVLTRAHTTAEVQTTQRPTTQIRTTEKELTTLKKTDFIITVTSLTEILAATTDPPSSNTTTNATSPQNATQGPCGGGRLRDTTHAPISTATIKITDVTKIKVIQKGDSSSEEIESTTPVVDLDIVTDVEDVEQNIISELETDEIVTTGPWVQPLQTTSARVVPTRAKTSLVLTGIDETKWWNGMDKDFVKFLANITGVNTSNIVFVDNTPKFETGKLYLTFVIFADDGSRKRRDSDSSGTYMDSTEVMARIEANRGPLATTLNIRAEDIACFEGPSAVVQMPSEEPEVEVDDSTEEAGDPNEAPKTEESGKDDTKKSSIFYVVESPGVIIALSGVLGIVVITVGLIYLFCDRRRGTRGEYITNSINKDLDLGIDNPAMLQDTSMQSGNGAHLISIKHVDEQDIVPF